MPPEIISEVFKLRDSHRYNLRHILHYFTDPILGVYNGTESASYPEPKIWEQIPAEIKNNDVSKREIKKWKPVEYPCRICRTFVPNLGFI